MGINFQKKIDILETQKQELMQKRLDEITSIIKKLDILNLDNDLIIGSLAYAKELQDSKNKDTNKSKLQELKRCIPSRFQKRSAKKSESKAD